jgi:hypothetical protein
MARYPETIRCFQWGGLALVAGCATLLPALPALAGVCSTTAEVLAQACFYDGKEERRVAVANCLNIVDPAARDECQEDIEADRIEHAEECREVREARLDLCAQVGENRYDPVYERADFDADFHHLSNPNPFFPLSIGNTWKYGGNGEINTVEVLDRTKRIEGLDCIVVLDQVFEDGKLIEGTNDWICQARNGDVHYLGEETAEYETFPGDDPRRPELVSIDGSFKAGRDGARGGILFLADPGVGDVYREEQALTEAEDIARVLSVNYEFGKVPDLDRHVPAALARLLCSAGDCIVTRNTSPLEPGVVERKYYARGIGFYLETDPRSGEVVQLTDCNFDARCEHLPRP